MPEIKFKYRLQIKRKVCYNGIHQGDISQGGAEAMRKSKLLGAVLLSACLKGGAEAMRKSKLLGAVLLSACLSLGSVVPAMADGMKVVTLGADLTEAQKQTMMKYFKTSADEVQILTITNQDERDHLSSYVPPEQIGTRDATTVINQAKMEVIQNNVQDANEIYNIVFNIAQQNNVTVDSEQMDKIVSLLEQIAQQNYNYEDMHETLERVEENVT